jgi:hypothetical protein
VGDGPVVFVSLEPPGEHPKPIRTKGRRSITRRSRCSHLQPECFDAWTVRSEIAPGESSWWRCPTRVAGSLRVIPHPGQGDRTL